MRRIADELDDTFAGTEAARFYDRNGNEGVDPILLAKLMFLLFFDDVPSERELMERLPERLDYLWSAGHNLDETTPHHSVLSKAGARWGKEVFGNTFLRTVQQCVQAGLADGKKIHVDSSLIDAHASKSSVVNSGPELIAAHKRAVAAQATKLDDTSTPEHYEAVNDTPGVITAVETTPGAHRREQETLRPHRTTRSQHREESRHRGGRQQIRHGRKPGRRHPSPSGRAGDKQNKPEGRAGLCEEKDFTCDEPGDTCRRPAGQQLKRRRAGARRPK